MTARGGSGHRVFYIQKTDHALFILFVDRLIRLVKFGRHGGVKVANVEYRCCWLRDEASHPTLNYLSADRESNAEE